MMYVQIPTQSDFERVSYAPVFAISLDQVTESFHEYRHNDVTDIGSLSTLLACRCWGAHCSEYLSWSHTFLSVGLCIRVGHHPYRCAGGLAVNAHPLMSRRSVAMARWTETFNA